jgi:hypothetical protein
LKSQIEKRKLKFKLAVFLALALAAEALAAPGVTFLEIPVGARESALGGAGAALITGPTSATYNAAAVAFTPRGVAFMHTKHFADAKAQFIGFTVHRKALAISPSFWGTRVSDIEYRTDPTRYPISTFDATNEAVGVTLAYRISERLAIGATGRYLHQKILFESSEGYSLDAGALARWPERGVTVGLAVNHFGHMNQFLAEEPTLPATVRGGVSYERKVGTIGSALVTADALAIRDSAPQFRGGVEFRAPQYLALRAGMVDGLDAQFLSVGFGLFIKHIQFDYAFIPYRENLGDGHRFSLGLVL